MDLFVHFVRVVSLSLGRWLKTAGSSNKQVGKDFKDTFFGNKLKTLCYYANLIDQYVFS